MASANETVAAVAALLPGADVGLAETIRDSQTSQVLRVRAGGGDRTGGGDGTGPGTLIAKRFPRAAEWARESAALAVVPPGAPAPCLIASASSPPVVVMTDAGTGPSVADALLTGTAAEATAALEGFADALAAFHVRTAGVRESFGAELAARSGGTVAASAMPALAARAASDLGTWCERLGVSVPDGALAALAALPGRVSATGGSALTPADVCPDNNVRTDGGYVLIDFEEAEWRPVAWDAAYLTVPWPTCWCSFRIPEAVAAQALARYRKAAVAGLPAAAGLPHVATPEFDRDVALAATGWALISASWFLGRALGDDPPRHEVVSGVPSRRAVILHRLAAVRDEETAPEALAEFAGRLRADLVRRWDEVPLAYAPAFRGGKDRVPGAPP